jgi:hypothetical protein
LDHVLSQLNPVHTITIYFGKQGSRQRVRASVKIILASHPPSKGIVLLSQRNKFRTVGWGNGKVRKQIRARRTQDGRWLQMSSTLQITAFFLECLTPEDGMNRLSRKVSNHNSMLYNIPEDRRSQIIT